VKEKLQKLKIHNEAHPNDFKKPEGKPAFRPDQKIESYDLSELYTNHQLLPACPIIYHSDPVDINVVANSILSKWPGTFDRFTKTVKLAMEMHEKPEDPSCDKTKTEPEEFFKQNRQTRLPFYWTKVIEPVLKKPR
jgi:hypothetical protein